MLCDNCGKNEASIKLTQIINGKKTEMIICEECAKKLGIANMDFEMPIDISNFLGDFLLENSEEEFIPFDLSSKELKCNKCNMTYKEFLDKGKFGCEECYKAFGSKIDMLLKKIQGANNYLGKAANNDANNKIQEIKENNPLEELKNKLKQAIKEERYEDAAKIRDEIKKMEEK